MILGRIATLLSFSRVPCNRWILMPIIGLLGGLNDIISIKHSNWHIENVDIVELR